MEMKDFEDVKIGDYGEDYNGTPYRVLLKGSIKDLYEYDVMGIIEEGLSEGYIDYDDDAVFVKSLKTNKKYVFVYGSDGFMAYV